MHWFKDTNTKPFTISILICVLLIMCWIILFIVPHNNLYAKSGIIVEMDYVRDTVTIVDSQGFLWDFSGCEDWEIGDRCACVMDDAGTARIFDDKIISVRYENWT